VDLTGVDRSGAGGKGAAGQCDGKLHLVAAPDGQA
jgi:hypothetical protein